MKEKTTPQSQNTKKPESPVKGERIAKVIARAGVCSRRAAEELITSGKVAVNGEIIDSPALNVSENDKIEVNGQLLAAKEKTRIWRYHKPAGLITSYRDDKGRPTVFDSLPKDLPRVISVGRLDFNSEGLLLLTNDGEAARYMESPATAWRRKYKVRVHGKVTPDVLDRISKGVDFKGVHYGKAEVVFTKQQGTNAWLEITLKEGKNREIRKICEAVGLTVTRLIRLSYGPFQLGGLTKGEVEEINGKAVRESLGNYKAKNTK